MKILVPAPMTVSARQPRLDRTALREWLDCDLDTVVARLRTGAAP